MTERPVPDMKLRLHANLRQKIEDAARTGNRSLNGEIVLRLQASFDGQSPPVTKATTLEQELETLRAEVRMLSSRVLKLENQS